jgi:ketosteroid isomerase-like protein
MDTNPRTLLAAVTLLTLSLSSACGPAPTGTAEATQATAASAPRETLELADALLAKTVEQAGPVQGFWPFLAEDAVFLEPFIDIVRGRDAIRSALAAAQPDGQAVSLRLHRVASGASDDGALGYTFGWFEETREGGATAYRKYLAMWRRDGGHWRLEAFVKSGGRGPPTAPPAGNPVVAGYHGFASPGDPAALAAEVAAADSAFAALAEAESTCVAFPAFADENAVVFGGGDFYWGIEWVRLAFSGCTEADHATWAPVHSASTGSGDLGWSVGNAIFWTDGTPVTYSYSKYLTVWARQPDGSWRWLLDAGNPRPAP